MMLRPNNIKITKSTKMMPANGMSLRYMNLNLHLFLIELIYWIDNCNFYAMQIVFHQTSILHECTYSMIDTAIVLFFQITKKNLFNWLRLNFNAILFITSIKFKLNKIKINRTENRSERYWNKFESHFCYLFSIKNYKQNWSDIKSWYDRNMIVKGNKSDLAEKRKINFI